MEGGYKPWKTQRIIDNSPDLDSYGKPLPPPPPGFYWERKEDRSWELKKFKVEEVADGQVNFINPSVLEHVVMPGDTIQGICLRYRVSAIELRRHNGFSGNNIQFSPALRIPIEHEMPITLQQDSHEIMIQRFKNITQEDFNEAKYYLEGSEYDLEKSLATWKEDKDWNDTHFHSNALSSDLPDDQDPSNVRPSRRGCLQSIMGIKPQVSPEETWTLVDDNSPADSGLFVTTSSNPPSYPDYAMTGVDYTDNTDIYVVPAASVSWKSATSGSSKSSKIKDTIRSIFGRKNSNETNNDVEPMLVPLIDAYPMRQIS